MRFLILNGPNLNLLGIREPDIYGTENYDTLLRMVQEECDRLGVECVCYQSNHEGDLVDRIQAAYGNVDGIVLNPAAYTHTSVAIPDAIKAVGIPTVEVHISDINAREEYRRHSFVSPVAIATVCGEGLPGYTHAIRLLYERLLPADL